MPIPMYLNYTLNLALSVARVQVYIIKKDVLRFFGQPVQALNLLYSNTGKIFSLLDRLVCFHKFFLFL